MYTWQKSEFAVIAHNLKSTCCNVPGVPSQRSQSKIICLWQDDKVNALMLHGKQNMTHKIVNVAWVSMYFIFHSPFSDQFHNKTKTINNAIENTPVK